MKCEVIFCCLSLYVIGAELDPQENQDSVKVADNIRSAVIKAGFNRASDMKVRKLAEIMKEFCERYIDSHSWLKVRYAATLGSPTLLFLASDAPLGQVQGIIDAYYKDDTVPKNEKWSFNHDEWELALLGRQHKVVALVFPRHSIESVHDKMKEIGIQQRIIPETYRSPHPFVFHISLIEFYEESSGRGLGSQYQEKLESLFMGEKPDWAGNGAARLVKSELNLLFKEELQKRNIDRNQLIVDTFSAWASDRSLRRVCSLDSLLA